MLVAPPKEAGRTMQEAPAAHSITHASYSTPGINGPQRRRQPPYGRKLLALRAQGYAPTLAVLILDGWRRASIEDEHAPWVLVIPDGESASCFDLRCVAGLFVYILAERIDRADEIAVQVWRFDPLMVYGWSEELGSLAFYVRDSK